MRGEGGYPMKESQGEGSRRSRVVNWLRAGVMGGAVFWCTSAHASWDFPAIRNALSSGAGHVDYAGVSGGGIPRAALETLASRMNVPLNQLPRFTSINEPLKINLSRGLTF